MSLALGANREGKERDKGVWSHMIARVRINRIRMPILLVVS